MSTNSVSPARVMQLGMGFWGSKTLLSAVELGVFTELAAGRQSLEALTARLGLHERSARDFLDALVALHMLERRDGLYANTPETDLYLDRAKPSYIGGLLEMANRRLYPCWGHLTEALRTGKPQNETKGGGEDPFAVMYADPATLKEFVAAMTGISRSSARAIAASFPWSEVGSFVDVGCAQGGLTVEIARAHPHLRGIGFDLPPVGPLFEEYVAENGAADRLSFQSGDFFQDPLPAADVIIMGHILHDWDLGRKQALVAKAYDALPKGGALLVYDAMIDDDRCQNAFGLLMSLNMLIETSGGFDYTGADCIGWMRKAGFSDARVQHLEGPSSLAISTK